MLHNNLINKKEAYMSRRIIIITYALCFFSLVSCDSVSSEKENITMENIIGKWYSLFDDSETGMKMILFLDNRSDGTAAIGILNGPTEVSLLEIDYYEEEKAYVFMAPAVD